MKAKVIFVLLFIICSCFIIGCGASKDGSSAQKQWKHFKIDLNAEEIKKVVSLQDDLEIDTKLNTLIIGANLTDNKMSFLIIGDENDPTSRLYPWEQICKGLQDYLLSYTGPRKIKL